MSNEDQKDGGTPQTPPDDAHVIVNPTGLQLTGLNVHVVLGTITAEVKACPPSAPIDLRLTAGDDARVVVPVRIARPPAGRLISVLGRVLTRHAFDTMIAPYIAQEQHEYYQALCRKEYGQARLITFRMHVLIWYNVLWAVASSIIHLVRRAG
jgi:hypothetical protein